MTPDYLLLGHITRDVLPDRSTAPGGTSLYAACMATQLGKKAAIVSAPAELPPQFPQQIVISFYPSPEPPTFENRYTPQSRTQILHSSAEPMQLQHIPAEWQQAPIVHLGPVAQDMPETFINAFPKALLGVTPQGWMRSWDAQLPSPVRYRAWHPATNLLQRIDALILSIEDVYGDEQLVADWAQHCRLVALTRGAAGSTLYLNGQAHTIPAIPAQELDPTGAGDVFAAALLIRLHETQNPIQAAQFASAAASLSVETHGIAQLPSRAAVEQRLAAN